MLNLKRDSLCACLLLVSTHVAAWEADQPEVQNRLNQQVLSQPFEVADDATLTKSLSDATERGKPTKSETKTGQYQYFHNGYYYPYWAYSRGYWY
jgi:hypothetical protein